MTASRNLLCVEICFWRCLTSIECASPDLVPCFEALETHTCEPWSNHRLTSHSTYPPVAAMFVKTLRWPAQLWPKPPGRHFPIAAMFVKTLRRPAQLRAETARQTLSDRTRDVMRAAVISGSTRRTAEACMNDWLVRALL